MTEFEAEFGAEFKTDTNIKVEVSVTRPITTTATLAYAPRVQFIPDTLQVKWRTGLGFPTSIQIAGHRVRKDGTLGARVFKSYYCALPEWLKDAVEDTRPLWSEIVNEAFHGSIG